ncbi:hypothetical protein V6N13_134677 [Hibiscus sabdariffa]
MIPRNCYNNNDTNRARRFRLGHDNDPQTTNIVGALGYLDHELARTRKAATSTDVYGYGTLMLEVASRRKPFEPRNRTVLVDWVRDHPSH